MPPIITEEPDYTQCHQSSPRSRIIHNATNHHRGAGLYTMPPIITHRGSPFTCQYPDYTQCHQSSLRFPTHLPISGLYIMPAIITEVPHSPAYIRVIHNASNHHRGSGLPSSPHNASNHHQGSPLTCLYPGCTRCRRR